MKMLVLLSVLSLFPFSALSNVFEQRPVGIGDGSRIDYTSACGGRGKVSRLEVPFLNSAIRPGNSFSAVVCKKAARPNGYSISFLRLSTPSAANLREYLEIGCTYENGQPVAYTLEWSDNGIQHHPDTMGEAIENLVIYSPYKNNPDARLLFNLNYNKSINVTVSHIMGTETFNLPPRGFEQVLGRYTIGPASFEIPYQPTECGNNQ